MTQAGPPSLLPLPFSLLPPQRKLKNFSIPEGFAGRTLFLTFPPSSASARTLGRRVCSPAAPRRRRSLYVAPGLFIGAIVVELGSRG